MPIVYLTLSVCTITATNVLGAYYNRRHEQLNGSHTLYNLLQVGAALLLWGVMLAAKPDFDVRVLLHAGLFGIFYAAAIICYIYALSYGSVALTSLIIQFSLIGTTVWGFIFWDTPITPSAIIGLCLVAVSLYLCLLKKQRAADPVPEKQRGGIRWLLFALGSFVGNAGCAIVQRTQQRDFVGRYGEEMMFGAMLLVFIICTIRFLHSERSHARTLLRRSWYLPVCAGTSNMLNNVCVMLLATSTLSAAVVYPVLLIGSLCCTTLFSRFAFHEKLSQRQWIGIGIGILAVTVLSL